MNIPENGTSPDQVMETLSGFRENDNPWRDGKNFSNVFLVSDEATELAERAYTMYLWENGLDPTIYPSLLRLETEIVAMAAAHLRGDGEVVGNFTSGGTESVLLAVKTARDYGRARKPDLAAPELVLPITAHPCFFKAAHYFGLTPRVVPVSPETFKPDVDAMRAAITDETVLLVGSAVSYAHGVVDPIPEIGALGLEHDIPVHVDGCIGGFLLPFFRECGTAVTDFDFAVPGVTSMSMDFHKYAYAAKGASCVLYRNAELRKHQIFAWSSWPGYTLINHGIQSSKSGGPLAATWAVLNHFGRAGYREQAQRLKTATERLVAGVAAMDGVEVLGRPEMSLLAVGSPELSVFRLCDEMKQRGWSMYPQFQIDDLPASFHLTVLPWNVAHVEAWLDDLRACVAHVRSTPAGGELAGLQAAIAEADFSTLGDADLQGLLAMAGLGGGGLPGAGMAEINEILNGLPGELRNRILTLYWNALFQYQG